MSGLIIAYLSPVFKKVVKNANYYLKTVRAKL